ncbi:MAG: WYL domain-containing protein, partial [Clostridia bacterium]|nr:WYL domain-containing protein [Clostridia bacterium]
TKTDDQHFKITVPVAVSPQFFAWVFGLGNYVTITAPDSVVKQMKDMLEKVSKRYK